MTVRCWVYAGQPFRPCALANSLLLTDPETTSMLQSHPRTPPRPVPPTSSTAAISASLFTTKVFRPLTYTVPSFPSCRSRRFLGFCAKEVGCRQAHEKKAAGRQAGGEVLQVRGRRADTPYTCACHNLAKQLGRQTGYTHAPESPSSINGARFQMVNHRHACAAAGHVAAAAPTTCW